MSNEKLQAKTVNFGHLSRSEYYAAVQLAVATASSVERVMFLNERNAIYTNRGSNELIQVKGFILADFEHCGTPGECLPYIREELQAGDHPYLIAAAAKALRGYHPPVQEALAWLLCPFANLLGDDAFTFDSPDPKMNGKKQTTAFAELFETFKWYGPYAIDYAERLVALSKSKNISFTAAQQKSLRNTVNIIRSAAITEQSPCCEVRQQSFRGIYPKVADRSGITIEDQDGKNLPFNEFFTGKPTLLTFFYTSCMNPAKCSLTINRLGCLQKEIRARYGESIKIAAISYDSTFDEPYRLKHYGINRGFTFDDESRFFRITGGMELLSHMLGLGVHYKDGIVVMHGLGLYILDTNANVTASFQRKLWEQAEVLELLASAFSDKTPTRHRQLQPLRQLSSILAGVGIAFFPKCPFCLMIYLSALGISGATTMKLGPYLLPAVILFAGLNVFLLFKRCKRGSSYLPLYVMLGGMILVLTAHFTTSIPLKTFGLILIFAAAVFNSIPKNICQAIYRYLTARFHGISYSKSKI